MRRLLFALAGIACLAGFGSAVQAADLWYVSDLISDSRPGQNADHTVTFQVRQAIPAGGRIIVTPQAGIFTLPNGFDVNDVDLATSTALTGPFFERALASSSSAAADGVAVATGTSGMVTVELNSTQGIPANAFVRLRMGTHAVTGATGDTNLANPTSTGSYRISIETRNASATALDAGTAMVAIVSGIALYSDTLDFDPPVRSNGMPTSSLPAGSANVEISLNTDEPATCRYATSTGVAYGSMTNEFTVTGDQFHVTTVTGLQNGTSYTFNVRCADRIPNPNLDDYPIAFSLANPLPPPGPAGGTGGAGGGGGGSGGNPFPPAPGAPQVIFSGLAYPNAQVTLLKDNAVYKDTVADSVGAFTFTTDNLVQGTYSFAIYAVDSANRRSSSYSTTITAISGTRNTLSGIVVPPTIALARNTVDVGAPAAVSGRTAPRATVEVQVNPQKRGIVQESEIVRRSVEANTRGEWTLEFPTTGLSAGTYEVRAKSIVNAVGTSAPSQTAYLGIGRTPSGDSCARSDLNGDKKVNLVDFSILLFHWNTTDQIGDINLDGRVNLIDFSVMLFCWTG